jgi:alpha-D-xyloside xylohydrolase
MDALYKGMKPELLNNLYALLYQKAAYEITKEVTGDGIVWARSAMGGMPALSFALGRRFL